MGACYSYGRRYFGTLSIQEACHQDPFEDFKTPRARKPHRVQARPNSAQSDFLQGEIDRLRDLVGHPGSRLEVIECLRGGGELVLAGLATVDADTARVGRLACCCMR